MYYIYENGDIDLVQGDNLELKIEELETDKNYSIYVAVQDKNRNIVFETLPVETNQSDTITIQITPDLTNLLTVKKSEEYGEYTYAIKCCYAPDNYEDTLLIGGRTSAALNVEPLKVEGTVNG